MPDIMNSMTQLHFLSPDGKSQSFDEKANGYGRGEGASFVVVKPLDAALRNNDVIRAVIRNTGVNQDGNTPGESEMPRVVMAKSNCQSEAPG